MMRRIIALCLTALCVHECAAAHVEDVIYNDTDTSLQGYLAIPANASGPLPVVIHVHTWNGLADFEKERANRTADELGYIGFAVSVYTPQENAGAAASFQGKIQAAGRYGGDPDLVAQRLMAAMAFLQNRSEANSSNVFMVGYCFGGSSVLQFARLMGGNHTGVLGVLSFHGTLAGLWAGTANYGMMRVVVANGAADDLVPEADAITYQEWLTNHSAQWEFITYGQAQHGFTHPSDGDHYHYEVVAEERSWAAMTDVLARMSSMAGQDSNTPALTTADVTYSDGNVTLRGYVAYPAGASAPLPVVFHAPTWFGLSDFEKGRANRTAAEMGYIGFAVSTYTDEERALAQNMSARVGVAMSYLGAPQRMVSRLNAAVAYIKTHAMADSSKIAGAGYCMGGTSVLQFARTGEAALAGVSGVVSFHGGLMGMQSYPMKYCPTRVAIYNGAADASIPTSMISPLFSALEHSKTHWEFTNYAGAMHGFTHPSDSDDHFHYDQMAEHRSWASMHTFLADTFAGKGMTSNDTCVHMETAPTAPPTTAPADPTAPPTVPPPTAPGPTAPPTTAPAGTETQVDGAMHGALPSVVLCIAAFQLAMGGSP